MPMIESRQSKPMGERKCAFEGCNALEFRTSGYCLRHKGGIPKVENESSKSERHGRKAREIAEAIVIEVMGNP